MRTKRLPIAITLLLTMSLLAGCDSASSIGTLGSTATTAETAVAANTDFEGDHDDPSDYEWDTADEILVSLEGDDISTDAQGAAVDGSTVRLTQAGTYRITGTLDDGQIIIDTASEAVVRLVLDDVDITCSDSSPVYVSAAEKVVVILDDGTQNVLIDGSEYDLAEEEEGEPNAALFSKANLTIGGAGSLTVSGNYSDGIVSKDGLIINTTGTISVDAADDGIRGTDYIVTKAGTIDVTAGAKGLKSTAAIMIEAGDITVASTDDAIHSSGSVAISDGALVLSTGDDGVHADIDLYVGGGTIDITDSFEGLESATLTIDDGDITIVAADDGLNASGGTDSSSEMTADGATGTDGVVGGQGGGPGGRPGDETAGDYYIFINGGTIAIDAKGDGVDSNGYMTMTDGTLIIHGPTGETDRAHGALDWNGTFDISGGLVVGTSTDLRMSQGIESPSEQAALYVVTDGITAAGTTVHVETSGGEGVLTFEAAKEFQVLVFSSPDLVAGTEYNVYFGGTTSGTSMAGLFEADAYQGGTVAGSVEAYE